MPRVLCVLASAITACLPGCATRDVAIVDAEARTVTHNRKHVELTELIAIAVSHDYGATDLIVKSTNGVEKLDLKKSIDQLLFWTLLPLLAPDQGGTNSTEKTPNNERSSRASAR